MKKMKTMKMMLGLAAMLCATSVMAADTLSLGAFDFATKTFAGASGTGSTKFDTLTIYLGQERASGDSVTLPSVSGYTRDTANSTDYTIVINISPTKTAGVVASEYLSKVKFNFANPQTVNAVLGQKVSSNKAFYFEKNGHYYQYVKFSGTALTWIQAYDAARNTYYGGRQGYLATVTSLEEDLFIYNASQGSVGWMGGTTLKPGQANGQYYNSFVPSKTTNPSDYHSCWYWACGPERGEEFFDTIAVRPREEGVKHYTEAEIKEIFKRNDDAGRYFNWIHRSPYYEPSFVEESCLTTLPDNYGYTTDGIITKQYSWNDIEYDCEAGYGWSPQGYLIEFGDQKIGDSHGDVLEGSVNAIGIVAMTAVITLNANGGSGGTASVTATYGQAMPTVVPPTKSLNKLLGYFDASGKQYYDDLGRSTANWDKTTATTLTAKWEKRPDYSRAYLETAVSGQTGVTVHNVSWNTAENAAYFSGSTSYLELLGKPLAALGVTIDTGFTIEFQAKAASDNGSWARFIDINDGTTPTTDKGKYFFLNVGNAEATYDPPTKGVLEICYTVTGRETGHEVLDSLNSHGGDKASVFNQWHNFRLVVQTGGYTTLYMDGRPASWLEKSNTLVSTLNLIGDFTTYLVGASAFGSKDGYLKGYMRNLVFTGVSQGGAWDGEKTLYRVSYVTGCDTTIPAGSYESLPNPLPTLERTNYRFGGWFTDSAFTVPAVAGAKLTGDVTLYAKWSLLTYLVTLNPNGGSGGSANVTATATAAMPSATMPTKAGYSFLGYFDANGTKYYNANGTSAKNWDKTEAATLNAQWSANSYTITLNPQNGAGNSTVTATYGAEMPPATMPSRTGYTFAGYFDAKTGGNKYYNADGSSARNWDKASTATLYAQWTGNGYVVTLPDGAKVNVTYGQKSANVPTASKPGYTFNGYVDANGTKYYNADGTPTGETWSTPSDVTLEPLFTANTYTITLDAQGGEGGTASVTATYDAALPKIAVPTLKGHTFLGYFDAAEDGTQCYDDAGNSMVTWDKESDAKLYAHWAVTIYTLTFDQQGGEGGTEFASVEYLAELPKVKVPALTGHTFLGYFDGTDEEAVKYYESNGGSTNAYEWTENKTLSAQWKANTYKYVLDGGAFTGEQAVVYGRVPSNIRVPKDEENVFMGYFDEAGNMVYDAEGHYVGDEAGYLVAGNTNLKAKWTEKAEVIAMVGAPKQRWPWNGKYDIAYTAESLKAQRSYVVNVEMTVTEPGATEPKTYATLVQIPSENGEHTLMADFSEFLAPETLDANATIRLRLFLTDKDGE